MASDELLLIIIVLLVTSALLWFALQRKNIAAKARLSRAEAINRLIDKFATAKEVIEFLETEQGRKFLEDPLPTGEHPRNRALRFVQFGVVFLFIGAGFFTNAYRLSLETDTNYLRAALDQRFWGTFSIAIGAGLLLVAFLTSVLVKRWQLDNGRTTSNTK